MSVHLSEEAIQCIVDAFIEHSVVAWEEVPENTTYDLITFDKLEELLEKKHITT